MGFNSLDYILFLIVAFIIYWQLINKDYTRVIFLLISSYLFYTLWNYELILLIIISSVIDYICGYYIFKLRAYVKLKKIFLLISIITNLSILCYFKYTNFFIVNLNSTLASIGFTESFSTLSILLPAGISFYTFQSMTYSIDIYNGDLEPVARMSDFFLFVAFFPQLIAGPIVRASEFIPQLYDKPELSKDDFGTGLYYIIKGFFKKMVLADFLAATMVNSVLVIPNTIADTMVNPITTFSSIEIFISLVAFHFQIYCDFSGYTDIAIGSAKLFGLNLPQNFNTPYKAESPGEFWKRWHMTLSRFVLDYVYKPLGGSRGAKWLRYRNLFITFFLVGFWHGANWNYIMFGVYHAIGVIITHLFRNFFTKVKSNYILKIFFIILTNLFVILSLPLFRFKDLTNAWITYDTLFQFSIKSLNYQWLGYFVLFIAIITHYIPSKLENKIQNKFSKGSVFFQSLVILIIGIIIYQVTNVISSMQTFIYFQF